ncbi:hypothetical protein CHARACLAT_006900 [Characodon lateralis]|uniref:Uncharacterized protein n=1 Tax=Characodon lateralis TaxID=208331 RepID=A0ABU7E7N3_9TELE|nr:hypothetical protein [Characodon lateralis]
MTTCAPFKPHINQRDSLKLISALIQRPAHSWTSVFCVQCCHGFNFGAPGIASLLRFLLFTSGWQRPQPAVC